MTVDDASPSILADRLREARRAAGISQADAAERIGVSRPTLIAVEQGRRVPKPVELVKLATLYGRAVHDLMRPTQPVPALSASFRVSGEGPREAAVQRLERVADDVAEVEAITEAVMPRRYPSTYDIAGLPVETAGDQVAQAERARLGLGDGPLPSLRAVLEEEVGIKVFAFDLPSTVAGLFAMAEPAGACVAVNALHPYERQRWTLAHEFGHFLTSRHQAEVTDLPTGSPRGGERFAEAFAASFLMPASSITRRFQSARLSRNGAFTVADLLQIAAQFEVSPQALSLRLEDLRLVAGGWWNSVIAQGLGIHEAQDALGIERRARDADLLPSRVRYLAAEAFLEGKISEGRLARLFDVDRVTAREMIERLAESSDVDPQGNLRSWTWMGNQAANG